MELSMPVSASRSTEVKLLVVASGVADGYVTSV
jgi:hypothetical protein